MKRLNSRIAVRSLSGLRACLLSATALIAAPSLVAAADHVFADPGPHIDSVAVGNAGATIYATDGTVANFEGTVTFEDGFNSSLNIGHSGQPGGTIVFNPAAMTNEGADRRVMRLVDGTLVLGNAQGRDFITDHAALWLRGGTLDLSGADLTVRNIDGRDGSRIANGAVGTNAMLVVNADTSSFIGSQIADGAGTTGLRINHSILALAGNNTYSGGTTIAGGVVQLQHSNALGSGAVTIEGGSSRLDLAQHGMTVDNRMILNATITLFDVANGQVAVLRGDIEGSSELNKGGDGELMLRGKNAHTGNIVVSGGTLTADSDDFEAIGDLSRVFVAGGAMFRVVGQEQIGGLAGNGTVRIDGTQLVVGHDQDSSDFIGLIEGNGAVRKVGNATLTLNHANTYAGDTYLSKGALVAASSGALGDGILRVVGSDTKLVLNNGVQLNNGILLEGNDLAVEVAGGAKATLAGVMNETLPRGKGLVKSGSGALVLTGGSLDISSSDVKSGMLQVDGSFGGAVDVRAGATLSGKGSIVHDVTIHDGGTLVGRAGEQLHVGGDLVLGGASQIDASLGMPGNTALFDVTGNLSLDGTLNVTDAGGFGQGVYRLLDYRGNLTDNGLMLGGVPNGISRADITIQTALANQVNVVVAAGSGIQFWDGANIADDGQIAGGAGVWDGSSTNWTDANGQDNGAWSGKFAVFQGAAGAVSVDAVGGPISVTGMQFAVDGYSLTGGAVSLSAPQTSIRVGNGSGLGAGYTARISSDLTGPGGLVKDDLGALVLTGNNSYQGDTVVRAGGLFGNTDSIRNNIVNDGLVAFEQSTDASFSGSITGTGEMRKSGWGTLALTGHNTLDWRIQQGGLTSATNLFRGDVYIGDTGTMRFEQNASGTYAGTVRGDGLLKFSSGTDNTIALTGDSGSFIGRTTVESGALAVNGALGGRLDVLAAGRLKGTGTVGDMVVEGAVAPGNSIGTLKTGSATFKAGSVYEVEVNAAGASDKIEASQTATIEGGTVKVLAGAGKYAPQTRYTILNAAGGRTGTFTGATSNLAFLDPSLSYDIDSVYLTMTRNAANFGSVGFTPNQVAAGGGVESLGGGNAVHDAILSLSADQARDAFDQVSGEIHASARAALVEDSRFLRDTVTERIRLAFGDVDAPAVWGEGFGSRGEADGDGSAARLARTNGGIFVGADAEVSDAWRFGAMTGYSHTGFDMNERQSSGSSDNYHVGLYGGAVWGGFALRTGAAYTWHDISTNRTVAFTGFNDSLKGSYDAATTQVFGELAYGFDAGGAQLEPFANLAHVNLRTDGFAEEGGTAALSGPSADTDATFTTLGLRASTSLDLGSASLTARGMLGWRHAYGGRTPDATMHLAGGDAFSIGGTPITRNAAVIEAGVEFAISQSAKLDLTLAGQFGSGTSGQSIKAGLDVKF